MHYYYGQGEITVMALIPTSIIVEIYFYLPFVGKKYMYLMVSVNISCVNNLTNFFNSIGYDFHIIYTKQRQVRVISLENHCDEKPIWPQ